MYIKITCIGTIVVLGPSIQCLFVDIKNLKVTNGRKNCNMDVKSEIFDVEMVPKLRFSVFGWQTYPCN